MSSPTPAAWLWTDKLGRHTVTLSQDAYSDEDKAVFDLRSAPLFAEPLAVASALPIAGYLSDHPTFGPGYSATEISAEKLWGGWTQIALYAATDVAALIAERDATRAEVERLRKALERAADRLYEEGAPMAFVDDARAALKGDLE